MNIESQDFRKSEGNYNNISNNELRKNDFSKGQKPYGIYKNIFLTDEEYKDLTNELGSIIPPTSRRRGAREKKKEEVLMKIQELVEVFVGL